uniref:Fibronectin type-III domain-containing protein n=1 Tax=Panagrolaimus superbus TaxID=310955 RepID=A0A914Y061_9BILA
MWPKKLELFHNSILKQVKIDLVPWVPPALPNGVITHYVINVNPLDPSEKSWTVNVGANMNSGYDKTVEAVVDNLVGGQSYQINSQAVTEAGIGDLPAASDSIRIEMPIMGMFFRKFE